jgi:hypothetical protein
MPAGQGKGQDLVGEERDLARNQRSQEKHAQPGCCFVSLQSLPRLSKRMASQAALLR